MTEHTSISDGYIKFRCDWENRTAVSTQDIISLNAWRNKLYSLNLIGAYRNNIGYGNISVRTEGNNFIITGSATGNNMLLTADDYSKVVDFDLDKNYLKCVGLRQASSESMTHAAIYSIDSAINAVIHVHNKNLWSKLLHKVPTTSKSAAYGTPEIAKEMMRLFKEENTVTNGIIVTEGHEEGIFTFGKDIDAAGAILLQYFHRL
jgi:L-ribulose-5-phosphate 4-epimerase